MFYFLQLNSSGDVIVCEFCKGDYFYHREYLKTEFNISYEESEKIQKGKRACPHCEAGLWLAKWTELDENLGMN